MLYLLLDLLSGDRQHLLEAGRDIAPCLLLLQDLQHHRLFARLRYHSLVLFLDLAGILDNGGRRYEPQRIDGFYCHHGILMHLVIFELFVKLLIVQIRGFGQKLLGLGVISDPYHVLYFLFVF